MRVQLCEGWVLVRWENNLTVLSLTNIVQILGIDKYAELPEHPLTEQTHLAKSSRQRSIFEHLRAAVIKLYSRLEVLMLFEDERRVDPVSWK
jgi:hypothetical protein